jgi:hypothetical protein
LVKPLGAALAGLLLAATADAKDFRERFTDPEDGQFDASEYLLDLRGALPVPIVITEPAIGYGGGLGLLWFSESIRDAADKAREKGGRLTPPDILAIAAFGTENGTKGAAAGGRVSFRDDTWRYRGGIADVSVNLDFYGVGGDLARVGYNLKGLAAANEISRRLGESDQWLGLRWIYLDFQTRFDPGQTGLTSKERAKTSSGLGLTYVWDSRDNIFTTRSGVHASIDATAYSPATGSDTTFQTYRTHLFAYIPAAEPFTLALRADARMARGDAPFYQLPFVDMRGVPAARYQDEQTAVVEIEGRYYATPRWIVLGFAGAARAWGRHTTFDAESTVTTRGVGFRYMLARRMRLSVGIDVARGPEDTAWYLQLGNAWR